MHGRLQGAAQEQAEVIAILESAKGDVVVPAKSASR
jgi:hypothetical protein